MSTQGINAAADGEYGGEAPADLREQKPTKWFWIGFAIGLLLGPWSFLFNLCIESLNESRRTRKFFNIGCAVGLIFHILIPVIIVVVYFVVLGNILAAAVAGTAATPASFKSP